MSPDSESEKRTISRWSRLAIQLNGAADSRQYEHITTAVVVRELESGDLFDLLKRELPAEVWTISKITDVDRHRLAQHWKELASAYEPKQFHVEQNGLALLVAYLLHLIGISQYTPPK